MTEHEDELDGEDPFDDPETTSLEDDDELDTEDLEDDPAYNPDDEDLERIKGG